METRVGTLGVEPGSGSKRANGEVDIVTVASIENSGVAPSLGVSGTLLALPESPAAAMMTAMSKSKRFGPDVVDGLQVFSRYVPYWTLEAIV